MSSTSCICSVVFYYHCKFWTKIKHQKVIIIYSWLKTSLLYHRQKVIGPCKMPPLSLIIWTLFFLWMQELSHSHKYPPFLIFHVAHFKRLVIWLGSMVHLLWLSNTKELEKSAIHGVGLCYCYKEQLRDGRHFEIKYCSSHHKGICG